MDYVITELTKTDIDKILTFEKSYAPAMPVYFPYDRETLVKEFDEGTAYKCGIFIDNELIAYSGYGKKEAGIYQMDGMVVKPEYRRHGIGQLLFDHRLSKIKEDPALKEIYVTCYPKNTPIIMLYLKNDFEIYDLKKDYYAVGADRIFLRKYF
jgi:ribosomal protein S18 acetylase RimI-like enzyme